MSATFSSSIRTHRSFGLSSRTRSSVGLMLAVVLAIPAAAWADGIVATASLNVDANSAITGVFQLPTISPSINESSVGEWANLTTITLSAPVHFAFDTSMPTTAVVSAGNLVLEASPVFSNANQIQFRVDAAGASTGAGNQSTVRFDSIRLRAVDCTGGTVGDASDVTVRVLVPPGPPANFLGIAPRTIVDVMVTAGQAGAPNMGLDHFDVSAAPLTQAAGSPIVITLTARDLCNNAIPNFSPAAPINVTATGGAATRSFASGGAANALTINDNANNTATIPVATPFDANGQGTFEVTSPTGENPAITIAATLGAATGNVAVHWITVGCALSPTGVLSPIGTLHAITATVAQNGATPVAGVDVNFSVTAGPNIGAGGVATTNALGQATFLYVGGPNTGIDTIQATGLIGAASFTCTDSNAVEWISPACSIAALPATAAFGAQIVLVDVERRLGVDAPDGTMVTLSIIGGPNTAHTDTQPTAAGVATFNYNDTGGPGVDTIRASGSVAGAPFECLQSKEWIQPSCELTPLNSVNRINTIHDVNITLLRRPGVPAAGVNVDMDVVLGPHEPDALVPPATIMTNAAGQFAVPFSYLGTLAGTDTIDASGTIDGVPFNCQATKEWINSGCGLNRTSPTNLTSQIGTSQTVTVTVLRTTPPATPAVNAIVNFSVTGVNPTVGAAVTNVNGEASFTYTGANTGSDTITATTTVDGVPITCTTTKDWINLSCSLDPPTDTNPVGSSHQVEVTLLQNGSLLDGVTLTFAVIAGPNTGVAGMVTGPTGSTGSGQATFTYTSGGNTGTDTIRTFGTISGVLVECLATKMWVAQPSCAIDPMTASLAGGMQTVNVNVDRAPGLNAQDGTTVNFLVIAGPNVLTAGTDTTTGGAADFTYTSNGTPGVDTIRASGTIAGVPFECLATKEWIQPSCELTPLTDVNRINTIHDVNITLLRRPGVPAAGVNVDMDVVLGPHEPDALVPPATIMTNAAGQFAVPFSYLGTLAGTDTIDASGTIEGVAFNCQATKEWIDSGCLIDPFTDTNQVGTDHTVTVTVLRTTPPNTPAVNTIVNFTVTGVNNEVGAEVTDVNGQASFTYTSNGTPGPDTITVDTVVDGVPIACNATKNWIDAACNITPTADTNLVGTAHTVIAHVTSNGAPVNNLLVSVHIISGPNAGPPTVAVTGPLNGQPAGQASVTYTSNGTPGTDTIVFSGLISGVPFTCQATKTWVDPRCSLAPVVDTNPTGTQHTVTGTVTRNGAAAAGINVTFTVTAGPNNGLVHNAVTNASGQAAFAYTGAGGEGTDTIEMTGVVDGIPFSCAATKTWQAPDTNGIDPGIEDGAPNNGDGNNDGIPDSLQDNVASFLDINGDYVTLVSPPGTQLVAVKAIPPPAGGIPPPDVVFPVGFFSFRVEGLSPGATVVIKMILHSDPTVNTYYKFGPTPIIPVDHFYSFLFDGTTGAEIAGNIVTLHLVDGQRGDYDLAANGVIVEPGAPSLQADNPAPITPASASCGLCGAVSAMTMVVTVLGLVCMKLGRTRMRRRI